MNFWLMKSEPDVYSIDDLADNTNQEDYWDGIRNYQARNMIRDDMKLGDQAFFYHSNCATPGIAGIMEIIREGYPDDTAFDPEATYFDPKSDPEKPRWFRVDVRFCRRLKRFIPLAELKTHPELEEMPLLRKGNRLSITPLTPDQWDFILSIESGPEIS